MARYIIKLTDGVGADWYLEWSSIVDAPVTYGMSRQEFERYYLEQYGRDGFRDFEERMGRVEKHGTSSPLRAAVEHVIRRNHAGDNDEPLTIEQLITKYCHNRPADDPPTYTWKDDGTCVCERGQEYEEFTAQVARHDRVDVVLPWLEAEFYDLTSLRQSIEALERLEEQLLAGELPTFHAVLKED